MIVSLVLIVLLFIFSSSIFTPINGFSPINNVLQRHFQQQQQTSLLLTSSSFRLYSIPTPFDTVLSGLASICRLPRGVTVDENILLKKSAEATNNTSTAIRTTSIVLQELYNIENNVDCRKVRERITELNLIVEKVICASPNSRIMSTSRYKFPLPQLVVQEKQQGEEKEEGQVIYLSGVKDILDHLNSNFGSGDKKQNDDDSADNPVLNLWNVIGNYAATALRLGRGMDRVLAAGALNTIDDDTSSSPTRLPMAPRPEKSLILYDYEGNQFCRLVREVLHELDLVYELRTAGKGSSRRLEEMTQLTPGGSTQCPFLIDPNTNVKMQESADIIAYLYKTYALWTPPNEQLQWISNTILPLFRPLFAWQARLQAGVDDDDPQGMANAKAEIESTITSHAICIYTYEWSPFSSQATLLLDNLDIPYHEISLGREWIPGFISKKEPDGAAIRAALLDMTGQSSLPHVFINGKSIGGLYSGTPGLVPGLEQDLLLDMIYKALGSRRQQDSTTKKSASSSTTTKTTLSKQTSTVPPSSSSSSRVVIEATGDFQ